MFFNYIILKLSFVVFRQVLPRLIILLSSRSSFPDLYNKFAQHIRGNHCYIAFTLKGSGFILFGAPFEKIELPRFGVARRMKYLVARQHVCQSHPLARFPRSVKFHFRPSGAAPPVYRVATSGGYFFCDFALASVARSSCRGEGERWAPIVSFVAATFLRDDNASAIDNRRDIISE